MKNKKWLVFLTLGLIFILYAIFGRYLVLPGYFASLDKGVSGSQIPVNVPVILVLRYLLWAFAFKLGIYFIVIGFMIRSNQSFKDKLIFIIAGFIYISFAYMNLSFNFSLFFGIGGVILTICFIYLFNIIGQNKYESNSNLILFKYLGYFFISMAIYNLCPFFGVKCFALEPEKMIKYGLQDQAISFANHIMIEFVLGFVFICLSKINLKKN